MILACDLGTTKVCAATVDETTGLPVAIASRANDADVADIPSGHHEQDPRRILSLAMDAMREAGARSNRQPAEFAAIGISGQMHGCLLVDRVLEPLTNLITWRDRRVAVDGPGSLTETLALLDDGVERRTGCRLSAGYGGAFLRWLQARGEVPTNARAVTMAGILAARLSGKTAIDEGHAASWGILDLAQTAWDERCVEAMRIPASVLPEVVPSGTPLGEITPGAAEALGISPKAFVCCPAGDAQASYIGAAGLEGAAVTVNIGTGSQVCLPGALEGRPVELDAWPLPFGKMLLVGACLCGGWSYANLRRLFQQIALETAGVEVTDADAYAAMNRLALEAEPDAGGLVFDTRFSGTRRSPGLTGGISGIDTRNLTAANLSRALLEGMVAELRNLARAAGPLASRGLVASGNAVRANPALRRIIARAFDIPCFSNRAPEEAVRGAAYVAAVGAGLSSEDALTSAVRAMWEPLVV